MNDAQTSTRTYSWSSPQQLATIAPTSTGLEFLQRMIKGELPQSALSSTLDFELVDVEEGSATIEARPAPFQCNAIGTVHGGAIASWLDTAMGYAIQSRLAVGVSLTTLDIQVRYLRAVSSDAPALRVIGTADHVGRTTATARAEVIDDQGRRFATATTSCLILRRS
ncbi:MAG TPA: PaaI family thioesterase [Microlunatus sp.]